MATIRKKGNNYQAIIRRSGWPYQSKTLRTKRLAEVWARDVESKMDKGMFIDQSVAKSTTLNDLMERYLVEVTAKRRKARSREIETYTIKRVQRDESCLCNLTLDKLKPAHFEALRDRRLKQPSPIKRKVDGSCCTMAESTVKRELTVLKCIVDHRFIEHGIPYNPASGRFVKRPAVNDERDVRLTDQQKAHLLNACAKLKNPLIRPFLEMGFETGARRGEILSLLWTDVDLNKRSALFRDVKNTSSPDKIKNRAIGLSPRALMILKQLPHNGERVFSMSENAFKLAFKRVRKKVGMSFFHFHDTRHDFISRMVEAGWPITLIMAQVGHTSTKSLQRYMNIQPAHLADELAKLH